MSENIVVICFKYPPEYSGYGFQLNSVINKINESPHNLKFTLLTAFESSKIKENRRLKIIPLNFKNLRNQKISLYVFSLKTFFWLIINSKKYSVIHCVKAGPEAVISNVISKLFRKKLIIKIAQDELSRREIQDANKLKQMNRKLRHLLLKNADNFIAISNEIKVEIKMKVSHKANILEIPNGVNTSKFHTVSTTEKESIRNEMNLPLNHILVMFAGAVNKRKGIIDLLEAIKKVKTSQNCTFIICGPILEEVNFYNEIEEINKKQPNIQVLYQGKVSNINEYMKASDIFVLPSYSEGLPNVLLEAASTGLALIATDIGGNEDIVIDGKNGFLVPTNSPQKIAKKLNKLIEDEELRIVMGKESRTYIEDNFSIDKVSHLYLKLYNRLNTEDDMGE